MTRHHDAATGHLDAAALAPPEYTEARGDADKLRALLAEAFPLLVAINAGSPGAGLADGLIARIDAALTEDDG